MTSRTLTKDDLRQFTGTEQWHRHGIVRNLLYTDGVKYVAETGGAYWLIDEIAFAQSLPKVAAEEFQQWHLLVNLDRGARLTCEDGDCCIVLTRRFEFTDFPLDEITFYYTNNVLLLPGEY